MISSKRREEAIGCQGAQGWKLEVDIEVISKDSVGTSMSAHHLHPPA